MASNSDVRLSDRMQASQVPLFHPATGKCQVFFLEDRRLDPHFLSFNVLEGADPGSANEFNTHFKLDGRRVWLYQQVGVGGTDGSPAFILRRTISYETTQLSKVAVADNIRDAGRTQIDFEVNGPPKDSWDSSTLPDAVLQQQGYDTATFPLHIKSHTKEWRCIRLLPEAPSHLKNFSQAKALSLLLGNRCYHPSVDQATWVENQHKALAAEADYSIKAVRRFRDVEVQCVAIKNFILVKIRFNTWKEAGGMDDQFAVNNLAQRYFIEGPEGSVLSTENAQNYVTRTGRIANFSAVVVDWDTHMDCAVQLRILQDIPRDDLALFDGQQVSRVKLHPCLFDKTKEDADLAHSRLAKDFDIEEIQNLNQLLTESSQSPSGLSARSIFLAGELPLIENIYDDGTDWEKVYHPDRTRQRAELVCWNRLDQWQKAAIKTCDEHPLALIHGPPGTGKTLTLVAYIISRFTRSAKEKLMVCSPRNVAVSVLVESTTTAMEEDHLAEPGCNASLFPIVHVESEGVIDARYLCGRIPSGHYHIQNIRIRMARVHHSGAFLNGVDALAKNGYISDSKVWKRYKEQREELTAMIMANVRVVFVTTSSAGGTFLKYLPFLPSTLIIDECGCAKPQDVAIPMMALGSALKRMVLAGDPSQLPPLIFSDVAKRIWNKTLFAELIDRGCKTTRLNIEYRSHSRLYESTSQLFYQGTVRSHHHTVQSPPPMLVDLKANLPLRIPGEGTSVYELSDCSHFLNVPDGRCFYSPGGSSANPIEATLAVSIALFLCSMLNIREEDVMILSGYTRQVQLMERVARSKNLCNIRVKTVDTSQADDAPFVILSTVRTEGLRLGFMQTSARTNVATSRQRIALYIVGNWKVVTAAPQDRSTKNYFARYAEHARSMWPNYVLEARY